MPTSGSGAHPDDDEAQRLLAVLRDGSDVQKLGARAGLARIFEKRGMLDEAVALLEANVEAGVKSAEMFRWLSRLHQARGDEFASMQAAVETARLTTTSTEESKTVPSTSEESDEARKHQDFPHDRGLPTAKRSPSPDGTSWRVPLRLAGIGVAVMLVISFIGALPPGNNKPTPSAGVTPSLAGARATLVRPTPTLTPVPVASPDPGGQAAAAPFRSGGLGLARSEWERQRGRPTRDQGMFVDYQSGILSASFRGDQIWYLERRWGDRAPASLEDARRESKTLLPEDARFARTYAAAGDRTVDLYNSQSLAQQISGDGWIGGDPGDFIVLYRIRADSKVTSIVLATGNNP